MFLLLISRYGTFLRNILFIKCTFLSSLLVGIYDPYSHIKDDFE